MIKQYTIPCDSSGPATGYDYMTVIEEAEEKKRLTGLSITHNPEAYNFNLHGAKITFRPNFEEAQFVIEAKDEGRVRESIRKLEKILDAKLEEVA